MIVGIRQQTSGNNTKLKLVLCAVCTMFFALCASAEAQQPQKVPRIGFLLASASSVNSDRIAAFRQGLRELSYAEGKNIIVDYRYADGKLDRLAGLAGELIGRNVEVIVTGGPADTLAAKKATGTIPIVMTFDNDPVGNGFVASPRATRRQHHWVVHARSGAERKTTRAFDRNRS